jgi:hypothetical protein
MTGHFAKFFSAGVSVSFAKERPEKAGGTQSASGYPATNWDSRRLSTGVVPDQRRNARLKALSSA